MSSGYQDAGHPTGSDGSARSSLPRPVAPAPRRLRPLTWIAVQAGNAAASLSRGLGLGDGSIIGGRVALAVDHDALAQLAAGRTVVLVSGTNGKTTTSHLLAAALRTAGEVAHNDLGANMADGAVAALARQRTARFAVIEVDELHLASVADAVSPAAAVLLNLSRDQLDRLSEVRQTATAIRQALARHPQTTLIANVDDPLTVVAAGGAPNTVWVQAGAFWKDDAASCPSCGRLLDTGPGGWWGCRCGISRPTPSWWLTDAAAHTSARSLPLRLRLPGRINRCNALMALAAAEVLGVPAERAVGAVSQVNAVAGRYATIRHNSLVLHLLLAKNPAGWTETIPMLGEMRPLLISVNAREADGRDTSWLWDVQFEQITPRPLVATGERAADLGTRLSYAGLEHRTIPDLPAALAALPAGPADVVANYTAFHQLRRHLDRM